MQSGSGIGGRWGLGNYGNLGTGGTEDAWTPQAAQVLDGNAGRQAPPFR